MGQGVVGEPAGLEHLLARQQGHGIVSKLADQRATSRQLVQARAQLRQHRAGLGSARWQEAQHPIGPAHQAVDIHKARPGVDRGWGQAGQHRMLEAARHPAAR